jgi:hypothetical protein
MTPQSPGRAQFDHFLDNVGWYDYHQLAFSNGASRLKDYPDTPHRHFVRTALVPHIYNINTHWSHYTFSSKGPQTHADPNMKVSKILENHATGPLTVAILPW